MLKKITETITYENINYIQLMLLSVDEKQFDAYIAYHQTRFQSIHSYVMNLVHQLNDSNVLNDEYLKGICHFLDIEQVDNVDTLLDCLTDKRIKSDGLVPLTVTELQNLIQCIQFMAKDKCIDINRIYSISEMVKSLREINRFEIV